MSHLFDRFCRRRRVAGSSSSVSRGAEGLESRCLLSAVMSHGKHVVAEVSVEEVEPKQGKMKKGDPQPEHETEIAAKKQKAPKFPDLSGEWRAVTHASWGDVIGVLQLTQHKKKLTGTLTNEGQPPGKFKAKIIVSDAPSSKLSAAAGTTQKQVKIQGTVENFSVASDPVPFETDYDPWDIPEPPDLPDPWDNPFDMNFDPPPPDWDDLPDVPDMEIDPFDFPPP